MRIFKNRLIIVIGVIVLIPFVLHFVILPFYDQKLNSVIRPGPYKLSKNSKLLHDNAFVADMHADALLWKRNLLERNERGHVDLVRLQEGGVDLQVFSVVTKVPRRRNYIATAGDSDSLPLLFFAAFRSPKTWFSPFERALIQAQELHDFAAQSSLSVVTKKEDLNKPGVKGLLALEGMHEMKGGEDALRRLHQAGYRMMGLAHFFDNEIAGSAHGIDKYALTELGRSLVPRMEKLGITIDLAHASSAAITETLKLATKPVVVSHGGVHGTCPGPRNLTDSQIRALAKNRAVIGIGYFKGAVCNVSIAGIVAAIRYAIGIAGIDHVGLGSDFDGNVTTPFDTSGLPLLTEALLAAGLSEESVRKVIGANVRRVLAHNLP